MNTFLQTLKAQQWQLIYSGGAGALLTDLASLPPNTPTGCKFENQPNGIEYFVDFDTATGSCDLYFYRFTANGLIGVPIPPIHVTASNQAGTSLFRSYVMTLDLLGSTYVIAVPQNLTGTTVVSVYGKPI